MKLIDSLIYFKNAFGRQGHDLGFFNIQTEYSETDPLEQFYNILEFNKTLTVGGEFFIDIYPKDMLQKTQLGWYMVLSKENQWVPDNIHWNKDWIVFATRNEDAIFYNQKDKGIYGSIDKEIFYKLSNSLSLFFYVLCECMKMEEYVFDFNTTNDDEEPLKEFLDQTRDLLNQYMDIEEVDGFMNFFFT